MLHMHLKCAKIRQEHELKHSLQNSICVERPVCAMTGSMFVLVQLMHCNAQEVWYLGLDAMLGAFGLNVAGNLLCSARLRCIGNHNLLCLLGRRTIYSRCSCC